MTPSTEALTTSAVMMVVIRAAGEVNTDLTADNLLRTRLVTIQLDGVLCRISELPTAIHVRKHWVAAGLGADKLPRQVEPTLVETERDVSPVGVVAKLVGYPAITATVMPVGIRGRLPTCASRSARSSGRSWTKRPMSR